MYGSEFPKGIFWLIFIVWQTAKNNVTGRQVSHTAPISTVKINGEKYDPQIMFKCYTPHQIHNNQCYVSQYTINSDRYISKFAHVKIKYIRSMCYSPIIGKLPTSMCYPPIIAELPTSVYVLLTHHYWTADANLSMCYSPSSLTSPR